MIQKTEDQCLEVRDIRKRYPGGTEALKGISLEIRRGDSFVLLGPNGAGKSTLVRILTTLSRADQGEVRLCGLDPRRDVRKLMPLIGVATQENDLDPGETCRNHLIFQGRLFGFTPQQSRERAEELITLFSLTEHADKKSRELSGGNKRKLHCALALVHHPRVLFLDEPTVGMDPEVRADFWETLGRINREEGLTLFLTTQYLEEAERHARTMALIYQGEIRYQGSVEEFIHRDGVKRGLEEGYLNYLKEVRGDC